MAAESKSAAEALVPQFHFEKVLNQDQNGRRISLIGSISGSPALMIVERAAFATDPAVVSAFLRSISGTTNLGANDIYRWSGLQSSCNIALALMKSRYLASHNAGSSPANHSASSPPDLKLNLIYPCTAAHVKKYSAQHVRMVTETPEIYATHVHPYMLRQREKGRLSWIFNIIEGRTEQEDVILRDHSGTDDDDEGFLLLPDLNWDRKTMTSLHLLALVERRDIWSLRDLTKRHIGWLKRMRQHVLEATTKVYPGIEEDELKLYVHYQPTYYHFHIHIVHAMLEAGQTQATGKAFGLENVISQLETIGGGEEAGMADVSLTYFLGEASELWTGLFGRLKAGETPDL